MKKWKRLACAVLVPALLTCLLPAGAFAENAADTWDGTADTSWYDANDVKATYDITTAEQLAGLAEIACNKNYSPQGKYEQFENTTFTLRADLDLAGHMWKAIAYPPGNGSSSKGFQGTFDGNGHTISNLSYSGNTSECGLFYWLGNKSTVKNLGLLNADITATSVSGVHQLQTGILAAASFGTILNCYTTGSLKVEGEYVSAGGLVGMLAAGGDGAAMTGCYSSANITGQFANAGDAADYAALGGLIGTADTNIYGLSIKNCYFDGSITSNAGNSIGGIVGAVFCNNVEKGVTLQNCLSAAQGSFSGAQATQIGTLYEGGALQTVSGCFWNDSEVPGILLDGAPAGDAGAAMGTPVSDWTDEAQFGALALGTEVDGVTWVMGIKHPTFAWDERNLAADYTRVDAAIEQANALRAADYTDFSAVAAAVNAVDRTKSKAQQAEVDAMAQAILEAIAALEKKPAPAPAPAPAGGAGQKQNPKTSV